MDLDLTAKVVLVTGGSKGIGAAIVRGFLAEGAHVINVNRSTEKGEALQAEYAEQGKQCLFIQGDLSQTDACQRAVNFALKQFGRIDVLVNNAGVNDGVTLEDGPAAFNESLQRNLVHYYSMLHFSLDALKNPKVQSSTLAARSPQPVRAGHPVMPQAKGGINGVNKRMGC